MYAESAQIKKIFIQLKVCAMLSTEFRKAFYMREMIYKHCWLKHMEQVRNCLFQHILWKVFSEGKE